MTMNTKTIQAALATLRAALMQTGASVSLDKIEAALTTTEAPSKTSARASATVSSEAR
jgi:hypothetical protein